MRRTLIHFLLLTLACTAPAWSDDASGGFPGIEKLMSSEEFSASGLAKLSESEREALNRWLVAYTAAEAPAMLRSNPEVIAAEEAIRIEAQIKPPFSGWSGETLFYLDNGQVWRQRLPGRYMHNGDDTAVVIDKNFLGFYKMTVTYTDKTVGVTRVR